MRSKRTAKNVLALLPALMLTFCLVGCNLFASKEEECLVSAKLSFNDPESLQVVQNLGDRGKKDWLIGDSFWLRYSNKNEFGGRVSANMACEKQEGKWQRSRRIEDRAKQELFLIFQLKELTTEESLIDKEIAERKACKTEGCRTQYYAKHFLDPTGERAIARAGKKAQDLAYLKVYQDLSDF
jgi:hypothetical protein